MYTADLSKIGFFLFKEYLKNNEQLTILEQSTLKYSLLPIKNNILIKTETPHAKAIFLRVVQLTCKQANYPIKLHICVSQRVSAILLMALAMFCQGLTFSCCLFQSFRRLRLRHTISRRGRRHDCKRGSDVSYRKGRTLAALYCPLCQVLSSFRTNAVKRLSITHLKHTRRKSILFTSLKYEITIYENINLQV